MNEDILVYVTILEYYGDCPRDVDTVGVFRNKDDGWKRAFEEEWNLNTGGTDKTESQYYTIRDELNNQDEITVEFINRWSKCREDYLEGKFGYGWYAEVVPTKLIEK
jgi:hypothetical protein